MNFMKKSVPIATAFAFFTCVSALAAELISNGGFETVPFAPWQTTNVSAGWWNINLPSGAHTGNRYEYIGRGSDGTTTANNVEDLLYQDVAIPAGTTSSTLTYWLKITSNDTSGTAHDTLKIELRNTSSGVISNLATYSNTDAPTTGNWTQKSNVIFGHANETVRITFHGKTDATIETVFRLDDVSLQTTAVSQPDILVRGTPIITPDPVTAGNSIAVAYTITNQGPANAGTSQTKIQVKNNSNVEVTAPTFSAPAVSANSSVRVTNTVPLSSSLPSGNYTAYVILDNLSALNQSNTNNDVAAGVSFGVNAVVLQPDILVKGTPIITPDPVIAGNSIVIAYTITNQGPANAGTSQTKVQVKNNSNVEVTAPTFSAPAVSANSSVRVTNTVPLLSSLPTGTYAAYVILDNLSALNQSNTNNDIAAGVSFGVSAPPLNPDISIEPVQMNVACGPQQLSLAINSPSPADVSFSSNFNGQSALTAPSLKPRPQTLKPAKTVVGPQFQTNVITVKFRDGLKIRARNGNLEDFGQGVLSTAQSVLVSKANGRWERLDSVPEERIEALRQTAQQNLGRAIADLNLQFNLFLPDGADPAEAIDALNALDIVELAQPIPRVFAPTPNFQDNQVYLNAAPSGVNALGVWSGYNVKGAGIKLADIEFGFNASHQDLPPVTVVGLAQTGANIDHGTAVLGEIAAKDNGIGVTGIAPECNLLFSSVGDGTADKTSPAITTALGYLTAGDVMLLELQIGGPNKIDSTDHGLVPIEWYKPNYDRIVTAVGQGIIVVEAAANGFENLDAPVYSTGNGGHWPFLAANDSGAILVGAGASPGGSGTVRSRLNFSDYGATVDLQGWGENVWTTGYGSGLGSPYYDGEGSNLYFTGRFNGTSSASPIVAGACVLMQSAYKTKTGNVLSPEDVKQILRATGSPQQGNTSEQIGPLPNLTAAIATIVPTASAGSFRIHNNGNAPLTVSSIALDQTASWISWWPQSPFNVPTNSYRTVTVFVDCSLAPVGSSTRHLVVNSDDPDENPYPGGVTVQVNKSEPPPNNPPNTPINVSPMNGAGNQSLVLSLLANTFSDADGDSHSASQWLVRRTSDNATVFDSGEDSTNKTNRDIPSGSLDYGTSYTWQVRYKDNRNTWSSYSTGTTFSTLPPVLNASRQAADMVFSWPTNTTGFVLEYTTSFPVAGWTPASPSPAIVGSSYVVTNTMFGNAKFYRLRKP